MSEQQGAIVQVFNRVLADFQKNRSRRVMLVDGLIAYSFVTCGVLVSFVVSNNLQYRTSYLTFQFM